MDEFIGDLAAKAGVDKAVAEKAVGAILGFLRKEGPTEQVSSLIAQIPGAETAIAAVGSGGLASMLGGGIMARLGRPGRMMPSIDRRSQHRIVDMRLDFA